MSFGTTNPYAENPYAEQADAMSAVLAQNWWMIALRGVLAIIVGVITFAAPVAAMLSLVLLFSAYMLVDGVFAITGAMRAARQHERWGLLVLEGVVSIAVAAIAVLWPGITIVAYVLLVAAWAIVTGALMLIAAFRLNLDHGRWWLVLGSVASLVYGALLIIAPLIGALVLTWWFGAYALVFGVFMLVLAFRLRARREQRATNVRVARNVA
ncbi:MAG TPA: HdeD family acid-resistance protein [Xanthobacteraceae bacterium]|nr:HdeD family acid-resistance protein [Xanthobacteraceae bacterium]